jgi:hypothetical protein
VVYCLTIDEAAVVAHTIDRHELMDDERKALQDANDVAELHKRLSELADPTQRQKDLLEYVGATFGGNTAQQEVVNLLGGRLPKIAYFSEYLRMPGQVSVNVSLAGINVTLCGSLTTTTLLNF